MNASSRLFVPVCLAVLLTLWFAPTGLASEWVDAAKLTSMTPGFNQRFGQSVALCGDIALVGEPWAPLEGVPSPAPGSACIFTRDADGTWVPTQTLLASTPTRGSDFGSVVALNDSWAMVGAPWDFEDGRFTGSVYVYAQSNGVWTQTARLKTSDYSLLGSFGTSIALSGSLAIIGAPYVDNHGAAYVFQNTGDTWTQIAKLTADDTAPYDSFGRSVDISGSTAIVGAPLASNEGVRNGSAYVFGDTGDGWDQVAKLAVDDAGENDGFGRAVAIEDDLALVSAHRDKGDGTRVGAVYPLAKVGGTWQGDNEFTTSILTSGSLGVAMDLEGTAAAIAGYDYETRRRLVFLLVHDGTSWTVVDAVTSPEAGQDSSFGSSVDIDGTCILVGSPTNDNRQIVRIADGNHDRRIDAVDLAIWQSFYAPLGIQVDNNPFHRGDFNDDNRIDGTDLALWQRNYDPQGLERSGAAFILEQMPDLASTSLEPVPEPATKLLVVMGAAAGILVRRRQRRERNARNQAPDSPQRKLEGMSFRTPDPSDPERGPLGSARGAVGGCPSSRRARGPEGRNLAVAVPSAAKTRPRPQRDPSTLPPPRFSRGRGRSG